MFSRQRPFHLIEPKSILIRPPGLADGQGIHQLIARCSPLDRNSAYCNLLQASHFSSTSILAEYEDQTVGFVSGYRLPESPSTLFVWQVAVDSSARGIGLGRTLLTQLLERLSEVGVNQLHTSITPSNEASWALFRGLSKRLECDLTTSDWMDKYTHFDGASDSETLVSIGPFSQVNLQKLVSYNENF